jgi:glycosyltransferase involved in cell wall biosynthesis
MGFRISAIIPAYNEEETIARIVEGAKLHSDEVVVIDDGSTDDTAREARRAGARVVTQENQGVLKAIRRGLQEAEGDVIVTLDADGQHNPSDIPRLVKPIREGRADLVMGKRPDFPYFSE